MAVAFSFSASFRWMPRSDYGNSGRLILGFTPGLYEIDPFYSLDEVGTLLGFDPLPGGYISVFKPIGSIGTDGAGVFLNLDPLPGIYLNTLKPIGSIGTELVGLTLGLDPLPGDHKKVALPVTIPTQYVGLVFPNPQSGSYAIP